MSPLATGCARVIRRRPSCNFRNCELDTSVRLLLLIVISEASRSSPVSFPSSRSKSRRRPAILATPLRSPASAALRNWLKRTDRVIER